MSVRFTRITVGIVTGTLLAGAWMSPAGATTATARPVMRLGIDARHHVIAPASTRPGLVHVVNSAARDVIVLRHRNRGVPGLVADINRAYDTAGSIRLFQDFPVVDRVGAHADEYVRLTPGTYYLVDTSLNKVSASQVHTLAVRGTASNAHSPRATLVQAAANGTVTRHVTVPRHSFVQVVNRTGSPHIISVLSIKKTATQRQIDAVLAHPGHNAYRSITGTYYEPLGSIAAHTAIYKRIVAKPGRYLLFAASLTHPGLRTGQVGLLTVR